MTGWTANGAPHFLHAKPIHPSTVPATIASGLTPTRPRIHIASGRSRHLFVASLQPQRTRLVRAGAINATILWLRLQAHLAALSASAPSGTDGTVHHGPARRRRQRTRTRRRWMSRPIAPTQMVRHQAIFPPLPYVRRIAFTSKFATWHQNVRLGFEIIKNARADAPARTDCPPARIGFSRSLDGRRNHGRPQTSIATPFLRRLPLSPLYLSLMAHVSTLRLERWRIGRLQGARNGTAPGPARPATKS